MKEFLRNLWSRCPGREFFKAPPPPPPPQPTWRQKCEQESNNNSICEFQSLYFLKREQLEKSKLLSNLFRATLRACYSRVSLSWSYWVGHMIQNGGHISCHQNSAPKLSQITTNPFHIWGISKAFWRRVGAACTICGYDLCRCIPGNFSACALEAQERRGVGKQDTSKRKGKSSGCVSNWRPGRQECLLSLLEIKEGLWWYLSDFFFYFNLAWKQAFLETSFLMQRSIPPPTLPRAYPTKNVNSFY